MSKNIDTKQHAHHSVDDHQFCCDDKHGHGHDHSHEINLSQRIAHLFILPGISFTLLISALFFEYLIQPDWWSETIRLIWYGISFIPVGFPVFKEAIESILHKDIFSEFLLMSIATIGAFAIGEYPEAVAVMLFYAIGEVFQTIAVSKATSDIQELIDQRPDEVTLLDGNQTTLVKAKEVVIGGIIQLKPGEKVALDGVLISSKAAFDTAALTGESKPDTKYKGETVLAGMINLNTVAQLRVTARYEDSKLSQILTLVHEASEHKSPTELFIRKFARIYTPIVVVLAIGICFIPYFFVSNYIFNDWLYRSLIFLVVSCPCALVISIPLGYFGGIGAASKNGILVKGGNYLDTLAKIQHVVTDKTGTLTEGVFSVQEVVFNNPTETDFILQLVNNLEANSTHPIASAIHQYVGALNPDILLEEIEEIPGHGLKATYEGKELLVGNFKLLDKFSIPYSVNPSEIIYTTLAIAFDGTFIGYITIADKIKPDAFNAIQQLHQLGIETTLLSGDKTTVVKHVAEELHIQNAYGDLLPEDKVAHLKAITQTGKTTAFIGDGINDAPVIALSDVGIAMGGLGSDAAIESADVVIQDDQPSKLPIAIQIGKKTQAIVWQNIALAFGVKAIVLILGAGGIATMWEAVFADVGVALLAILNAVRIQRLKF